MADRPILFSAPMVLALLREAQQPGTGKTQTRRILRPQPVFFDLPIEDGRGVGRVGRPNELWPFRCMSGATERDFEYWARRAVPPFAVGDRLWVKETWRTSICQDTIKPSVMETPGNGYGWPVWYEADGGAVTWRGATGGGPGFVAAGKLRPSLFMPRWASRLSLLISEVRIVRLNGIGEADAVAEGIERLRSGRGYYDPTLSRGEGRAACRFGGYFSKATDAYQALWNSLHGPDAWTANPWVVAVTFLPTLVNICTMPEAVHA